MTDGIVGAGGLGVFTSAIVVAMGGDQRCEKEGYCRQGMHWDVVGDEAREVQVRQTPITALSRYANAF